MTARRETAEQRLAAVRAWLLVLARVDQKDRAYVGLTMAGDVQNLRCIRCEAGEVCRLTGLLTPTAVVQHLRNLPHARHDLVVDEAAFAREFAVVTR